MSQESPLHVRSTQRALEFFEEQDYPSHGAGFSASTEHEGEEVCTVVIAYGPHATALQKWVKGPDSCPPWPEKPT